LQEPLVSPAEAEPLDPEVVHVLDHQPVLAGVMHVMQLQLGIGLQQLRSAAPAEFQRVFWLIVIPAQPPDGNEQGLRQPGNIQRRGKVHQRAVARADHYRLVASLRVARGRPLGEMLRIDLVELVRSLALHRPAERKHLLACAPWQEVDRSHRVAPLPEVGS
jgi:hypothetical protein